MKKMSKATQRELVKALKRLSTGRAKLDNALDDLYGTQESLEKSWEHLAKIQALYDIEEKP